jgi:non-specific serine/threonine protein kinase/serine/threonine-protein kinase
MTVDRWERVKEIFHAALERRGDERSAFVAAASDGDTDLQNEVESLLASDADSDVVHSRVAADYLAQALDRDPARHVGCEIGPFRITSMLGEGGMGVVYLAERVNDFHQRVAIKLVRPGLTSDGVVSRFRDERRILAVLEHPNIARLLDGGATAEGQPYLVMEYVEGTPITSYADTHTLPVRDRLRLFRRVCAAVQYAHQNLVVHCDLKPGNVLVTADGTPKLMDFGLATLLRDDAARLGVERTGTALAFTPAYASPEQLRGMPPTTATDVYSLGVVLRELIAGTADGDVEAIGKKAIASDMADRYHSVEQLSDDIQRYLNGEPVHARPHTFTYRASRFVRRHRLAMGASALVFVSLSGGLAATLWQERAARRERARADRRFNDVRELAHAFVFDFHDAIKDLPGSTDARRLVVDKALQYLNRLAAESSGDPALQRELIEAYLRVGDAQGFPGGSNLGDTPGATRSYRSALAISEELSRQHPDSREAQELLARSHDAIGTLLFVGGDATAAMPHLREEVRLADSLATRFPHDAAVQQLLASAYEVVGDASGHPGYKSLGDASAARAAYQQARSATERLTRDHPDNKRARRGLGVLDLKLGDVALGTGDVETAVREYSSAATIVDAASADDPLNATTRLMVALVAGQLGQAFERGGDVSAALTQYDRASDLTRQLAEADPKNAQAVNSHVLSLKARAALLAKTRRRPEAIAAYRLAEDEVRRLIAVRANPARLGLLAAILAAQADLLVDEGHTDEARAFYHEALPVLKTNADRAGASFDDAATYAEHVLDCRLAEFRDPNQAIIYAAHAVELTHDAAPKYLELLARAYAATGRLDEARTAEQRAIALMPASSPWRLIAVRTLAGFEDRHAALVLR